MKADWNIFLERLASSGEAAYLKPLFLVFGVYLPYLATLYVASLIASARSFKLRIYYASLAILSVLISEVVTNIMRNVLRSPRPYADMGIGSTTGIELGYGLPSAHMAFFVPLGLIVFSIDVKAGFLFSLFVVIMGVARALLLLHYPIDIILGVAIGAVGYFAAKALLPKRLAEK